MDPSFALRRKAKVIEWNETLRMDCPYGMNDKVNDKTKPVSELIGSNVNILENVEINK